MHRLLRQRSCNQRVLVVCWILINLISLGVKVSHPITSVWCSGFSRWSDHLKSKENPYVPSNISEKHGTIWCTPPYLDCLKVYLWAKSCAQTSYRQPALWLHDLYIKVTTMQCAWLLVGLVLDYDISRNLTWHKNVLFIKFSYSCN